MSLPYGAFEWLFASSTNERAGIFIAWKNTIATLVAVYESVVVRGINQICRKPTLTYQIVSGALPCLWAGLRNLRRLFVRLFSNLRGLFGGGISKSGGEFLSGSIHAEGVCEFLDGLFELVLLVARKVHYKVDGSFAALAFVVVYPEVSGGSDLATIR